jgi:hypothetical protein
MNLKIKQKLWLANSVFPDEPVNIGASQNLDQNQWLDILGTTIALFLIFKLPPQILKSLIPTQRQHNPNKTM